MSVVLLIDDEPQMGSLLEMALAEFNVRIAPAKNLSEALEAARKDSPTLVLLDIALGTEDGLEILPRLCEEPNLSRVPVVAFSVHDSRRKEALDKGAAGFVAKPFKAAELRAALRPYLASKK